MRSRGCPCGKTPGFSCGAHGVDVAMSLSATATITRRAKENIMSTTDDGLSAFLSLRRRLFSIAYRVLGSAAEAEDIVQDAWVRWQTADRSVVRDAAAFLATTTTRLAINVMQSARARRETYVDTWLSEPVDTSADPRLGPERHQSLAGGVFDAARKADACRTSRLHPSRGVRLSVPGNREGAAAGRSQCAASGDSRPAARRQWPKDAREFDGAETPSRRLHRRSPPWRRGRPRMPPRIGRRLEPAPPRTGARCLSLVPCHKTD